jgi:hypothetical protein
LEAYDVAINEGKFKKMIFQYHDGCSITYFPYSQFLVRESLLPKYLGVPQGNLGMDELGGIFRDSEVHHLSLFAINIGKCINNSKKN